MTIDNVFQEQIKKDCLYKNFYKYYSNEKNYAELLFAAGAIKEPRTIIDEKAIKDLNILTLPIKKVEKETVNGVSKRQAVIVSTGSFSPMHQGHVDSMILAKKYVESLGYQVVQGVFSISHDSYVSFKNNGIAKLHIGERTEIAYNMISNEEWITIDRFEGEFVSCPINFSTVLERVRNYLIKHNTSIDDNLEVFYVFGSDNAEFSRSFVNNSIYHSLCVERSDYSYDVIKEELKDFSNVHFIKNNNDSSNFSSTIIRKSIKKQDEEKNDKNPIYFIRTDNVSNEFATALKEIIKNHMNKNMEIRLFDSSVFKVDEFERTISLDKFVKTKYNLDVSRIFDLAGCQKKANGMTSLNAPIEIQTADIESGEYYLIDDDSVSGFTMNKIEQLLKEKSIKIIEQRILVSQLLKENERLYDIIDARDFLFNADKGGLVVDLFGNGCFRVPYIFPFVNLTSRANVKTDKQILFSLELLKINKKFKLITEKENAIFSYIGKNTESFIDHYSSYFENYLENEK